MADSSSMLIYSLQPGPRLKYILEFFSNEIFDQPIQLTTDLQAFINYNGAKINYGTARNSEKEFWIYSVDLLFERGVKPTVIRCFEINGNKAFFQNNAGDFAFDIFAAAFYLLSRYEEYLPHTKDKYGRYAHSNALACKESFLHLPLINYWLSDFKKALLRQYPGLKFKGKIFCLQPSYDIDIAWSYRNKGWWRTIGGFLRSAIKLDWYTCRERVEVLMNKKKDPFDAYGWLHTIHTLTGLKAVYFFLIANRQEGYDKNTSPDKKELQQLIKEHDARYITGIHPSWQSGDDDKLLKQEIEMLGQFVGHDINYSRQHYLRFTLPATYQKLISLGIRNDYSMGYGTINGFRASVASSYLWYDLENEKATNLLIHPFCFMDANAFYELKFSPAQALEELINFYGCIKEIDGLMITLWHNNFLGTDRNFAGWQKMYESFLVNIISDKSIKD